MRSRRYALILTALLLVSALPAAAAGPASASCGALPWLGEGASSITPADLGVPSFVLKTACTTSAQCLSGQTCSCGQCHSTCPETYSWSCACHVCFKCPPRFTYDPELCACSAI